MSLAPPILEWIPEHLERIPQFRGGSSCRFTDELEVGLPWRRPRGRQPLQKPAPEIRGRLRGGLYAPRLPARPVWGRWSGTAAALLAVALLAFYPLNIVLSTVLLYQLRTVWDSVNSRVLWPVTIDPCSKIQQMLVYHPATDTWQDVSEPGNTVHAGTLAFDPSRNVMVAAGSAFCTDGSVQTSLHLYRWAP